MAELNAALQRWIPEDKQEEPRGADSAEDDGITVAGLNTARGMRMTGGTVESYLRTLSVFLRENTVKIRDVDGFIEGGSLKPYKLYVHSLRSALASIGSEDLSKEAERLEAAAENGDWALIRELSGGFFKRLAELLEEIKAAVSERTVVMSYDKEALNAELAELIKAMEDYDLAKVNSICNNLHVYVNAEGIGAEITELLAHRLNGEYEEAAEVATAVLNK
jgi:HPt (histidine-containing phosphotransfer) domain-containing protein